MDVDRECMNNARVRVEEMRCQLSHVVVECVRCESRDLAVPNLQQQRKIEKGGR